MDGALPWNRLRIPLRPVHAAGFANIPGKEVNYSCVVFLLILTSISKTDRTEFFRLVREKKKETLFCGSLCLLGYFLILCAMNFATNVSYINAFRQLSLPLGALIAIKTLSEKASRPKIIGLAVLTIALIVLAII